MNANGNSSASVCLCACIMFYFTGLKLNFNAALHIYIILIEKAFSCIYCFWYRLNRLWNHIWSLFRLCILLCFKMKTEVFKLFEFVKSWEMQFVHFFFSSKRNIALYSAIYHRTENTFKRMYIKCTNVVMSLCKCIR